MSPTIIEGEENLLEVDLSQRKCKFSFENDDLELFKVYTQSGCKFECMLKSAHKHCNCTPWEYPHLEGKLIETIL